MKMYLDSSSFAKRFIKEPGSQEIDDLCSTASRLGLSVICFTEIISALNRKIREKVLTHESYRQIKYRLSTDIRDAEIINLHPSVIEKSIMLLESNLLRSLDALHIACALEWGADLFVSSDRRQITAAKKGGLNTNYIA